MDERQSRKLRQLQAEMIALANDREKATSADACRAIDAKLHALAERGAAMKHVKMSPEEKPCAACKRPTARTVVSEGRAHRFCSVECASSGVQRSCDGVASMASRWSKTPVRHRRASAQRDRVSHDTSASTPSRRHRRRNVGRRKTRTRPNRTGTPVPRTRQSAPSAACRPRTASPRETF